MDFTSSCSFPTSRLFFRKVERCNVLREISKYAWFAVNLVGEGKALGACGALTGTCGTFHSSRGGNHTTSLLTPCMQAALWSVAEECMCPVSFKISVKCCFCCRATQAVRLTRRKHLLSVKDRSMRKDLKKSTCEY